MYLVICIPTTRARDAAGILLVRNFPWCILEKKKKSGPSKAGACTAPGLCVVSSTGWGAAQGTAIPRRTGGAMKAGEDVLVSTSGRDSFGQAWSRKDRRGQRATEGARQ